MRYRRRCSPTPDPRPALRSHRVRPPLLRPYEERIEPAASKPGKHAAVAQSEMTSSPRLAECGCPPIRRQASAGLASCGSTAASPPRTRTLPASSTRARHLFAAAHRPPLGVDTMHSDCEPFVRLPPVFDERQTRPSPSADEGSEWRATTLGGPKKPSGFAAELLADLIGVKNSALTQTPCTSGQCPPRGHRLGQAARLRGSGQSSCHFTNPLGLERPGWSAAGGRVVRTSESGRSRALSAGC